MGHFPVGQLTCVRRRGDRLLAVANLGVGAGRQNPRPALLGFDIVRLEPNRRVQVREGSIKVLLLKPDASTHSQAARTGRIEPDRFVQVFERLVVLTMRKEVDRTSLVGVRTSWVNKNRMVKNLQGLP